MSEDWSGRDVSEGKEAKEKWVMRGKVRERCVCEGKSE